VSDKGGIKGTWDKQSSGAKAAIIIVGLCCIGVLLVIAMAGMFSPDTNTQYTANTSPTTTTQTEPTTNTESDTATTTSTESYIEISYPEGSWDGSITLASGNNEEEINFDGSGTKRFDLSNYSGKDVYVHAQKNDDSSGKLSVIVVINGETKLTQSTTEGYGIVSGWVFSWE